MPQNFSTRLINWQKQHGRHNLPWQNNNPYHIWLSEIMLQQTQVQSVIPYFQNFLKTFPTIKALAESNEEQVLKLWSGLGYYARARNLHHSAQTIATKYQGQFPKNKEEIQKLKGIGESTAAAIAVFAYGEKQAILDGNVKRVLSRHIAFAEPIDQSKNEKILWEIAKSRLPDGKTALKHYTQGLMDLGSLICTLKNPKCQICPVKDDCQAQLNNKSTAYPIKKNKKIKKERTIHLLNCCHQRKTLFQKRPAQGIWASLYSLPEFEDEKSLTRFAKTHNIKLKKQTPHYLKHQLTHLTLHLYSHQGKSQTLINLENHHWQEWQKQPLALPSAIKKLLTL